MTFRVMTIAALSIGLAGTAVAGGSSDRDRTKALQTQLHGDSQLADNAIKVEVNGKRVRLTGTVDSVEERLRAEEVVLRSDSSLTVENQLQIVGDGRASPPSSPPKGDADKVRDEVSDDAKKVAHKAAKAANEVGDMANDAWITSKIKAQMMGNDGVHASGINVDTADGVVTLRGNVRTEAERQKALSIARTTRGVVKVADQLSIVPHGK
jgi:hyperosmotically inducible protein